MARTPKEIQTQMDEQQALQPELTNLDSPSQAAIYTLWKFITSFVISFHEQLWDLFKAEIETIITTAVVGTDAWVKDQVDKFQYDLVTPQVVQIVDFVPGYNPVDTDLQIITRSSVKTLANKTVSVKVAKSDPPVQLDALELSALQAYLDNISFAGVGYNAQSLVADKLSLTAEIFFNGEFSATITASVEAAINNYMAVLLPFNGFVRIVDLTDAIQAVDGVSDVVITDFAIRADATAFGSRVFLVQAKTTLLNKTLTAAGYIVEEDTAGEKFLDRITYTPEV